MAGVPLAGISLNETQNPICDRSEFRGWFSVGKRAQSREMLASCEDSHICLGRTVNATASWTDAYRAIIRREWCRYNSVFDTIRNGVAINLAADELPFEKRGVNVPSEEHRAIFHRVLAPDEFEVRIAKDGVVLDRVEDIIQTILCTGAMFHSEQWRLRDGKVVPFGDAPCWQVKSVMLYPDVTVPNRMCEL